MRVTCGVARVCMVGLFPLLLLRETIQCGSDTPRLTKRCPKFAPPHIKIIWADICGSHHREIKFFRSYSSSRSLTPPRCATHESRSVGGADGGAGIGRRGIRFEAGAFGGLRNRGIGISRCCWAPQSACCMALATGGPTLRKSLHPDPFASEAKPSDSQAAEPPR